MRNTSIPNEIRQRLLRAGFSRAYANRTARELQDHWDETIDSLIASGASPRQAELEAAQRLGSPEALANEITVRMQKSSWLGRFPTLAFAVLALALTILWWISLGSLAANFCGVFREAPEIGPRLPLKLDQLNFWFDWIRGSSYVVLPSLCCFVAERFACGWQPALWGCLVLSIHNAMHFLNLTGGGEHGDISWGYSFYFGSTPSLISILAPIMVFALWRAWNLRDEINSQNPGPTFC